MKLDLTQDVTQLSDNELLSFTNNIVSLQEIDRKEFALYYYVPANKRIARLHDLTCGTIGIFGGNGSGKTDHALVEGIIRCTGIIPVSLQPTYPTVKLRGPIKMRVVCESLTTVLDPIILPKLNYLEWSGILPSGGNQGHWGWIPRHCLFNGSWKKSYDKRLRILSVLYRNPLTQLIEGTSSIQFMSYDQDASDFASGDVHYCLHDEPPTHAIWNENRSRVMRGGTGSTTLVSMTWPDNPAAPVDWIFDEIFDKGTPGPLKDSNVEVINIHTTDNPHLDQNAVTLRAASMTKIERDTRIYGLPIRFSNRIHPDFTDQLRHWCYECGTMILLDDNGACHSCHGTYVSEFCHVVPITVVPQYPCVCLLDPHPRKPHMLLWVQITPNDDYECVAERLVEGGVEDVREIVTELESNFQYRHITRLMDPNMGASPSGATRELTWQTEFDNVGFHFDLADDSDIGRSRINDYLKPDPIFQQSRLRFDISCTTAIFQMKRYIWDERHNPDRLDVKQTPLAKNDDFPTMLKYLMNRLPETGTSSTTVYRRPRPTQILNKGRHASVYTG